MRKLGIPVRWAVPAGVVTVVAVVGAATAVASASVPPLPHQTAAQLLADVAQATSKPLGPFTATVQESASLGLPQLPESAQQGGIAGLASGTQSISIWYADPQHIRIAEPVQAGESDLRLNGRTLWLWNSKTQTATKVILPAHVSGLHVKIGNGAVVQPRPATSASPGASPSSLTPLAAANQVLKALGPSTVVRVSSNVNAPTGPAYQLVLAPKSAQSLIGRVVIVIDGTRHIPVSVEVFGRGSAGQVYSVGFTALTFGQPGASNFTFTPPPGAHVKSQVLPGSLTSALPPGLGPAGLNGLAMGGILGALGGVAVQHVAVSGRAVLLPVKPGMPPTVVPIPKQAFYVLKARFIARLPASMSKAQRAQAIKAFDRHFKIVTGPIGANGGGFLGSRTVVVKSHGVIASPAGIAAAARLGKPKIIGTGWLSVIATPANPNVAAAIHALLHSSGPAIRSPQASQGMFGSSSAAAPSPAPAIAGGAGAGLGVLRALLLAMTPVHGTWGSGRLLQTRVLSVLITSKGQVLVGAVTPTVLFADVPAAG